MTAAEIAETLGMPLSTVSGMLKRQRHGPARPDRARAAGALRALPAGRARPHRHQEARPDRGRRRQASASATRRHYRPRRTDATGSERSTVGWEYVHIAVDDYSRLAYAEVLADEKATTAVGFLRRAVASTAATASSVERILTDNGGAYLAAVHALACRRLGIRHLRTRPYRPQTNGKAERFIRTLLAGWAYGAIYRSSHERTPALDGWLWHYNHRRRHSALGHQPPVTRTNLLGS